MPSKLFAALVAAIVVTLALAVPPAQARSANVAALQVALRALHHYNGAIDGIKGPQTRRAVRRFQRAHRLDVDGIAGPRTRRALGRRGRPSLGSRVMKRGHRGWDVAALQFLLTRRGFRTSIDGGFGASTEAAVRRFQSSRGLTVDGLAGRATIRAAKRRGGGAVRQQSSGGPTGPVRFLRPVNASVSSGFGMRWGRMHHGLDFSVPAGTRVGAAGVGVTEFAGWNSGGYGYLVIVQHRLGYQTWYAHLSRVTSWRGERVSGGTRVGLVGSTGNSSGPHLHWEVRHNGVPVNPLPMLLNRSLPGGLGEAPHGDDECGDGEGRSDETALRPDRTPPRGAPAGPGPAEYARAKLRACVR
jgi:peptidoglycan hydrolase-like protein with peptidoglycan-binding domain